MRFGYRKQKVAGQKQLLMVAQLVYEDGFMRLPDLLSRIRLKRLLFWISPLAAWFTIHTAVVAWDGLTDENKPADLAVVFGNTVLPPGKPSPRLRARLDAAVVLYRRKLVPKILVSGGVGREGFDEALVMQSTLLSQGIPAGDVLIDQQGYTTEATCRAAAELVKRNGWSSAIAVTQFHHVSRAKLAMRRAGIDAVTASHARYFELRDLYSMAREFVAWYKYALFSR